MAEQSNLTQRCYKRFLRFLFLLHKKRFLTFFSFIIIKNFKKRD